MDIEIEGVSADCGELLSGANEPRTGLPGDHPGVKVKADRPRLLAHEAILSQQINDLCNRLITSLEMEERIELHKQIMSCRKQLKEVSRLLNRPGSMPC